MIFKRQRVKQILEAMERFWDTDVNDNKTTYYLKHFKTVESVFKKIFIFLFLSHIIRPFISMGSSIFNCYIPPAIPIPIFFAAEVHVLILAVSSYASANIFVCSIIVFAVMQFRQLNLKIRETSRVEVKIKRDLEGFKRNLNSIVKYQQFLVRLVVLDLFIFLQYF